MSRDPRHRRTMTAVALLTQVLSTEQPSLAVRDLCSRADAQSLLPELVALAADHDPVHRHKNLFEHSLAVLDNTVSLESHSFLGEASPETSAPPDLTLRMAALLHDVGKPATRVVIDDRVTFHGHDVVGARLVRYRLRRLGFDRPLVTDVAALVRAHMRLHGDPARTWTDAAVRRLDREMGHLTPRLLRLARADCTTRSPARAARLARRHEEICARIRAVRARDVAALERPDLDGNAVMEVLGIGPGPLVGLALTHLLAVRRERGELSPSVAQAELCAWYAVRSEDSRTAKKVAHNP
jgi:poly(A) polymerase